MKLQATGKLEPKGVTKEVKAPLGVSSDILVKDGNRSKKDKSFYPDTEAAKAKLKALEEVRCVLPQISHSAKHNWEKQSQMSEHQSAFLP